MSTVARTMCLLALLLLLPAAGLTSDQRSEVGKESAPARDPLFAPTECESKSKPKRPAVGGRPVLNNIIVSQPAPEYPAEAKAAGISGRAVVFACVDEEGKVYSARADSGNRLLLQAALEAVYKARFRAPTNRGKPVRVSGVVYYDFKPPESGGRN